MAILFPPSPTLDRPEGRAADDVAPREERDQDRGIITISEHPATNRG